MIMPWKYGGNGATEKVGSYKPYKNTQFNKKLAKARSLLSSINETSLKKEDKAKLKQEIIQLLKDE